MLPKSYIKSIITPFVERQATSKSYASVELVIEMYLFHGLPVRKDAPVYPLLLDRPNVAHGRKFVVVMLPTDIYILFNNAGRDQGYWRRVYM